MVKKLPRIRLTPVQERGEFTESISLALAILRRTKTSSVAHLEDAIGQEDAAIAQALASIVFTKRQVRLIEEHHWPLSFLRLDEPKVNLLVCDTCNDWIAATGTSKVKCTITYGCTGQMSTVRAATQERNVT